MQILAVIGKRNFCALRMLKELTTQINNETKKIPNMNILVGTKHDFAIEVGNYKKDKETGKLRFWINNQDFGDFKRSDKLSYAVRSLKDITDKYSSLYDDSFDSKTNREIFELALVLDAEIGSLTDEDYEQMDKYERFSFNLGSQFDDVSHVVYVKDGQCFFSMVNEYRSFCC
ncbi:MAG TPA: hypothetical protein VFS25_12205 [Chitinophaga sp.]|uniref:hypothetical protein n=1 Tax=Chitinophaga sp. TaxID=1869181 RepID=UPI002DBA2668|nr:hypothetical protein [Chitinophaga sp.]HEU4553597.1 hypothetical protein [Chitinophaga sp.]